VLNVGFLLFKPFYLGLCMTLLIRVHSLPSTSALVTSYVLAEANVQTSSKLFLNINNAINATNTLSERGLKSFDTVHLNCCRIFERCQRALCNTSESEMV